MIFFIFIFFFFSSRRRHTRSLRDWSSDVCSSDLSCSPPGGAELPRSCSPVWREGPSRSPVAPPRRRRGRRSPSGRGAPLFVVCRQISWWRRSTLAIRGPVRVIEVRRRYPGERTRVTSESRRSQLPEPSRVNAVLLHLKVQGLVVGSEKPRRLALVATGDLEDPADRLLLGVRCGGLGDLPQRGVDGRRLSAECGRRGLQRRVDGEDREVLRLDHVRSEEDGSANDVPELPHVARPGVAQKDLSRRFRDFAAGAAELHAGFREKLVRQVEDVIALPEGRQGDPELVQTVIDILAEPASPHLSLEGHV